jgi:hypothetical protein
MLPRASWRATFALGIVACGRASLTYSTARAPSAPGAASASSVPSAHSTASPPAEADPAERLVERAAAARATASGAIQLVEEQRRYRFEDCDGARHKCLQLVVEDDESPVRAAAGRAIALLDVLGASEGRSARAEAALEKAEELAKQAREQAERIVAARAATEARLEAEAAPVDAAVRACNSDPSACKTKCDRGDSVFCLAVGRRLWSLSLSAPPRLVEAKTVLTRACEQMNTACLLVRSIDRDERARHWLWQAVEIAVDKLARTRAECGEQGVPMPCHTDPLCFPSDAEIREFCAAERYRLSLGYCSAKKEFVAYAGEADFAIRADAHCKKGPPAEGWSGAPATWASQCRVTFSATCPPTQANALARASTASTPTR